MNGIIHVTATTAILNQINNNKTHQKEQSDHRWRSFMFNFDYD